MNEHDRDVGPDAGQRDPSTLPADTDRGTVGTGEGYSGQEFDSEGQAEWRKKEEHRNLPADGAVRGSGAGAGGGDPGEDYDVGTPGGAAPGPGAGKTPPD
ncbi:hypothetical protein [Sphingomonas sp. Leaf357]|uniref:hypothetical protein n=1 Tax=Sphingomonas sp. Leaf357 TaxID=1736350 RepID=UPI000A97A8EE|nr:hypothetical protein [Sphingomonas sp. Leaf357]